jgi:hypothetical protein
MALGNVSTIRGKPMAPGNVSTIRGKPMALGNVSTIRGSGWVYAGNSVILFKSKINFINEVS